MNPVKYRHPVLVIIFWIITFGIYGIYWLVSTASELKRIKAKDAPEPMWILWMIVLALAGIALLIGGIMSLLFFLILGILLIILAFVSFIAGFVISIIFYWKHSVAVDYISKGEYNYILLFIFWIIFSPVSVILSQLALNKIARKRK
jgi:uncharacterized membrane-anchored protein